MCNEIPKHPLLVIINKCSKPIWKFVIPIISVPIRFYAKPSLYCVIGPEKFE